MELKTMSGTVGPSVVDIRSLYANLGIFTYDPGYGSTVHTSQALPILMENREYCYTEVILLSIS